MMVVLTYKGHRVLLTDQVAAMLGTNPNNIQKNYVNNKEFFEEGEHYFRLTDDDLKAAKELTEKLSASSPQLTEKITVSSLELSEEADAEELWVPEPAIGKRTASLMLWTRRGIMHHVKMVNSKQAWTLYKQMEDVYFHVLEGKQPRLESAAKEAGTLRSREKYWRGQRVWTSKEVLALLPCLTKNQLRYIAETVLTDAETMVLRGADLWQFKKDNGNCSAGKSLRIFTDVGLTRIGAYYNVATPTTAVGENKIELAIKALQTALQVLTA